jgi:hypothetical protein
MYRLPDDVLMPGVITATVLELVRHIQAGIRICGMSELASDVRRQGLLCEGRIFSAEPSNSAALRELGSVKPACGARKLI